ncbi:MAG: DnaJ domain-containing protein [Pseudomonadota bacterium]|nr:DnaJ domain-containing protein [Pseudomonadota bacterium]
MKKKSTKHSNFFKEDCSKKRCDEVNCENIGEYYAPKSPNNHERYLFCLEHIRLYNKRWDFFAGKSQDEIYEYQKNDFLKDKPTKPFSIGSISKIKFQFNYFFDKQKIRFRKKRKRFEKNGNYSFNEQVEHSLMILNLTSNSNQDELKKRYKILVKKYHPDVKNDLSNKEIKMKDINKAYKILLDHFKN